MIHTFRLYKSRSEMDSAQERTENEKKSPSPEPKVPKLPLPISTTDPDDEVNSQRAEVSPTATVVDGMFRYGSGLFN